MRKKNSFILYADTATKLELLNMEQRGLLMTAIFGFANCWDADRVLASIADDLVRMMFLFISESMLREREKWDDTCTKRSEAGKRGAKARTENLAKKQQAKSGKNKQTQANQAEPVPVPVPVPVPDTVPVPDSDILPAPQENEATGAAKQQTKQPQHQLFGEYRNVRLTSADLALLQQEYPDDWSERIERLSAYLESTGKQYRNHLVTIRAWAKKEHCRAKASPPNIQDSSHSYDIASLHRLKNLL